MPPRERKRRIIIAGSRSIDDYWVTCAAMDQFTAGGSNREAYEIVSGGARGVDQHAKQWAERYDCEFTVFDPRRPKQTMTDYDADRDGKKAFVLRNQEMAEYADALVAVWDGESTGTRDMIDRALDEGLDVFVSVVE